MISIKDPCLSLPNSCLLLDAHSIILVEEDKVCPQEMESKG